MKVKEKVVELIFFFALGGVLIAIGGQIGGPWAGFAAMLAGVYTVLPDESEIIERILKKHEKETGEKKLFVKVE